MLGSIQGDLACAVHYERGDDPDSAFIKALAVSKAYWGQGLGGVTMRRAWAEISREPWRDPANEVYVHAWVANGNTPSQRMCERSGMTQLGTAPEGHQRWAILLPALTEVVAP